MKLLRLLPFAAMLARAAALAAEPLYHNDFAAAETGPVPAEFMVISGAFVLREEAPDGKFLELPGAPLESFGLLFGPTPKGNVTASARFFGTKNGRKFPAFGVSLGGVGGYRLQVSAAKKTLDIFQGDEVRQSVAYAWPDATWTSLRVQLRKTGDGWVIAGKAWPAGTPEPAAWTITFTTKEEPPSGRPGIWGSPYSGTPIRFDDLDLSPAP